MLYIYPYYDYYPATLIILWAVWNLRVFIIACIFEQKRIEILQNFITTASHFYQSLLITAHIFFGAVKVILIADNSMILIANDSIFSFQMLLDLKLFAICLLVRLHYFQVQPSYEILFWIFSC